MDLILFLFFAAFFAIVYIYTAKPPYTGDLFDATKINKTANRKSTKKQRAKQLQNSLQFPSMRNGSLPLIIIIGLVLLTLILLISFLISRSLFGLGSIGNDLAHWLTTGTAFAISFGAICGYGAGLLRDLNALHKQQSGSSTITRRYIQITTAIMVIIIASVILSSLPNNGLKLLDRIASIPTPIGELKLNSPSQISIAPPTFKSSNESSEGRKIAQLLQKLTEFGEILGDDNKLRTAISPNPDFFTADIVPQNHIDLYKINVVPMAQCLQLMISQGGSDRLATSIAKNAIGPLRTLTYGTSRTISGQNSAFKFLLTGLNEGMNKTSKLAFANGLISPPGLAESRLNSCDKLWQATQNFNFCIFLDSAERCIVLNMSEQQLKDFVSRPYSAILLSLLQEINSEVISAVSELNRWVQIQLPIIEYIEKNANRSLPLQRSRIAITRMEMIRILLTSLPKYKNKDTISATLGVILIEEQLDGIKQIQPNFDWSNFYGKRDCSKPFAVYNFNTTPEDTNATLNNAIAKYHIISTVNYLTFVMETATEYHENLTNIISRSELLHKYLSKCPVFDISSNIEKQAVETLGKSYLTLHERMQGSRTLFVAKIQPLLKAKKLLRICRDVSRSTHLKARAEMAQSNRRISDRIKKSGPTQFERCAENYRYALKL